MQLDVAKLSLLSILNAVLVFLVRKNDFMKVYAFLPAKGNSERIKSKNNRYLSGEKLFIRGLKKLLKCKSIDKVFLDSDSERMHDESSYLNCYHMLRDKALASNKTDGHSLFMNELKSYDDADIYVQYLCTSPFLKPETIDHAVEYLISHPENDSVIFMKKEKTYNWCDGKPCYDINKIPNSKDLKDTITEGMALYVIRKDAAIKLNRRYGDNPAFIYGDAIEYIDINNLDEMELATTIADGIKSQEVKNLNLLKHFISSPMISDILDDLQAETNLDYGGVIQGLSCNFAESVIFGRAKTLKLRKLRQGEDFNGIYDALSSYESVSNNDVIIVENEAKENAYFGDLNARLAIRAGACGVVVDSVTRDVSRVRTLGLPVFSKGRNAADVRRRATVESINKKITIQNVEVCPGDLIFADGDAVVVIKDCYSQMIINKLYEKIKQENSVSLGIIKKESAKELIDNNGGF